MPEHTTPTDQPKPASSEPDFIWVLFDHDGPTRVLVPAGAKVQHIPYYSISRMRYFINVIVNDQLVGLHCGERTHRVITFGDEDGAARLCEIRNDARRIRAAIQA